MEIIKYFNSITFREDTREEIYRKIAVFEDEYNLVATYIKFDMDYPKTFGQQKAYVKFEEKC